VVLLFRGFVVSWFCDLLSCGLQCWSSVEVPSVLFRGFWWFGGSVLWWFGVLVVCWLVVCSLLVL